MLSTETFWNLSQFVFDIDHFG